MDAKLKSLKVADLKEICSHANIPTTTRSTKADLITKILASQLALDTYSAKYQQNGNTAPPSKSAPFSSHDSIPAPPEEVDWTLVEPSQVVPAPAAGSSLPPTKPAPALAKPPSKVPPPTATPDVCETPKTTSADEELEKRKARAARFGIALVESTKPKTKSAPKSAKEADDPEKLRARAGRFGATKPDQTEATTVSAVSNKKRDAAVLEEVDLDEQERRRKRAERFGISVAGAKA